MRRSLLVVAAVVTLAAPLAYAGTVPCRDGTEQASARACDKHGGIARQIAAPEGQADKAPATPRAQTSTAGGAQRSPDPAPTGGVKKE